MRLPQVSLDTRSAENSVISETTSWPGKMNDCSINCERLDLSVKTMLDFSLLDDGTVLIVYNQRIRFTLCQKSKVNYCMKS